MSSQTPNAHQPQQSKLQTTVLAVLCLVALSGVGMRAWRNAHRPAPVVVTTEATAVPHAQQLLSSGSTATASQGIVVHVAGAVRHPNVYAFHQGQRVADAIKRAGGALPTADLDAINLAAKLTDGEQVYVPRRGEQLLVRQGAVGRFRGGHSGSAVRDGAKASDGEPVNINSADSEELQRLPGVGPATAERILQYRAEKGSFGSPEELMEVKGIGEKRFEKMRPMVRVQ